MAHLHNPQSLAKQFCQGIYVQGIDADVWREAFSYILRFPDDRVFQQARVFAFWIKYGGQLRRLIKDDSLVLNVLRKCFSSETDHQLTLYRGECWFLFDQNSIGFCWTSSMQIAKSYAKGLNAVEKGGGVLLKCDAPAEALLAGPWLDKTGKNPEKTYICDPSALLRISILEYFTQV